MGTKILTTFHETDLGRIIQGDSLEILPAEFSADSVNLIVTSPPFGLVRKKDYGNVDARDYVKWFKPFGEEFKRILRPDGSLVIDIGGAWVPGQPTRSLYHFKLLVMLCEELGFHLAQEFDWGNLRKVLACVASVRVWLKAGGTAIRDTNPRAPHDHLRL